MISMSHQFSQFLKNFQVCQKKKYCFPLFFNYVTISILKMLLSAHFERVSMPGMWEFFYFFGTKYIILYSLRLISILRLPQFNLYVLLLFKKKKNNNNPCTDPLHPQTVVGVMGIVGNILSILVLSTKDMRNSFNLLLIVLAW